MENIKARKPVSATFSDKFSHWQAKHDQLFAAWDEQARQARKKKPIDPGWLCYAINEWLPEEAVVVREVITNNPALTRFIRRVKPGNFFMGNIKGLGSGMGVARGVKLASANQPVLHLVGNGAFIK